MAKRTCILHRIRHMDERHWLLKKIVYIGLACMGPVSWSHLRVKVHFQKLG